MVPSTCPSYPVPNGRPLRPIDPGAVETIYVNMPARGLTRAFGREPVTAAHHTAKQRMQADAVAGTPSRDQESI